MATDGIRHLKNALRRYIKNGTVIPATRQAILSRDRSSTDFGTTAESRQIYEDTRTDRS